MTEHRDPRVPGVLDGVRDGWHSLGGGDAARCPGCPVCKLSETAARLDPGASEHLQAAAAHLVSAGRELLAALAPSAAQGPPDAPSRSTAPSESRSGEGTPVRTKITVHTGATPPQAEEEKE